MSDSSRVQLAAVDEVTWGVTPASALAAIRYTSETLGKRIETVRSDEVRSDRQTADIVQVGAEAEGGFEYELSYLAFDDFIQSALGNIFSADQGFGPVVTVSTTAPDTFSDSGSGFPTYAVGAIIQTSGFVDPANNGYFEVVTSAAGTITVTRGVLVTETAGASVSIEDGTLVNGVLIRSHTFEKFFSGITQYFAFPGGRVNTWALNLESKAKALGSFGLMSKAADALSATTAGSGAYTAAPTNPIMNASNNVAQLFESGAVIPSPVFVKQLNFEVTNNLRNLDAVGSINAINIGYGRFNVTGQITVYFEDEVMFDRYLAGTQSSIAFRVEDSAGNSYAVTFPAVRYVDGDIVGPGNDDDVVAVLQWEAFMHAAQGIMMRVDRFAA